ncbi:dihydrolipoamide acetyltransferase family protein [Pelomicrobium methylotrophicum]|uniref:Dihydrolipoamide acetyltransferase component of pyruvate dehydrogenase complex n=1 Tax=Pelomicrobium methylotrophicum TaxID=2602750 RepID=A0A5C7EUF5_9PROT|nr:dihydrolipoamide acetyltransferase family protein [Pelomicrobium methylotrophicum]TXF12380.1 2-oxo acid dehydrogenase subunit E2 [Pelomicrobium methylotrophicum]
MKLFKLPDLGEGLHEAEIAQWHVKVGDEVRADQPLVSMETAKAIVDIPAPYSGRIAKLFGEPGEVVHVGAPLVAFEGEGAEEDAGTVVGHMPTEPTAMEEASLPVAARVPGGIKATPAVRALAHQLKVDLAMVTPTGPDGLITAADVRRVARILAEAGPREVLRGVRRAMAQNMTLANAEVASATLVDDADIHAWRQGEDVTVRLIRALVAGCRAEPSLNAWYDAQAMARWLVKDVHLGLAVDTPDGLFVPVIRDVDKRGPAELRQAIDKLVQDMKARRVPPEDLRGNTITLSNFGMIAGRYAAPIVLPPTVAILGAGRIREEVVVAEGAPAVHRILPLSLTFDHRTVTGGEAGRFLAAVIADLEKPL